MVGWLQIHGQGRYCYFGNEYEGGFENGNKSGQGVLVFNTGDVYEGTWANDMQSGQGSLRYSCGSRYVGEWVNGKKQGLVHTRHTAHDKTRPTTHRTPHTHG